jgi:hypothetical protein
MQIEAPSGTKRATASRMDMSLGGGTPVSYSVCRNACASRRMPSTISDGDA